jgi:hypothetical protein
MSHRDSPAFYCEQAARLEALSTQVDDPALKLQFHDIAKSLQLLADFAAVKDDPLPTIGAA